MASRCVSCASRHKPRSIGTLSPRARRRLAGQALQDPAVSAAIRTWEWRLAALAEGTPAVAPPARVWERIRARLGHAGSGAPGVDGVSRTRWWSSLALWRGLAIAGFALAFALGISLLAPRGGHPFESVAVVLAGPDAKPALIATAERGSRFLTVKAVGDVTEPTGGSPTGAPTGPVLYTGRIERTY